MKERIIRFADGLAAKLEKHPWWWVGLFSIPYLANTLLSAARTPLWFDELFTFYVARLPRLQDVWSALASGFDPNPPLLPLLTRLSQRLLGEGEAATRLPATIGFWVMCVSVFWFLRRRCSATSAALGMVLPLLTGAYAYAYEARAYGLVLGCAGVALLCWQSVEGRWRTLALTGLALSLMAAVSSHYYAVLLIFPIALGEVVRSAQARRLDLPVWVMMALGLAPCVALLPLVRSALNGILRSALTKPDFWAKPTLARAIEFYSYLLWPGVPVLVACAALAVLLGSLGAEGDRSQQGGKSGGLRRHEVAATLGLLALPLCAYLAGTVATGSYFHRHALPALLGLAYLAGLVAERVVGRRPGVGAALLAALFGWFVCAQLAVRSFRLVTRSSQPSSQEKIWPTGDNLPVAVSNALRFLQMAHYGTGEQRARIRYVTDPETPPRVPDFIPEVALRGLLRWVPLPVEDYREFTAHRERFWVYYSSMGRLEWLIARLAADGWRVELHAQDRDLLLFLVTRGEPRGQTPAVTPHASPPE